MVPEKRKFPAVSLSQALKCVASCEPAMFVQVIAASDAIEPVEAAANDAALRVVSVAAFDVPFAPGSPTCSFTYTVATAKEVLLPTASSHAFAKYEEIPVAISLQPFPRFQ